MVRSRRNRFTNGSADREGFACRDCHAACAGALPAALSAPVFHRRPDKTWPVLRVTAANAAPGSGNRATSPARLALVVSSKDDCPGTAAQTDAPVSWHLRDRQE